MGLKTKDRILQAFSKLCNMSLNVTQLRSAADFFANRHIVGPIAGTVGTEWSQQKMPGGFLAVIDDDLWYQRFDIVYDLFYEAVIAGATVNETDLENDTREVRVTFAGSYTMFDMETNREQPENPVSSLQNAKAMAGIAIRYNKSTGQVIDCFPI
jgi:hypothetical protein